MSIYHSDGHDWTRLESKCQESLKRKRDDDELDYEGLSLLFDESNEDALVESIDEKVLKQENILPQASGNSVSKVSFNVVNS